VNPKFVSTKMSICSFVLKEICLSMSTITFHMEKKNHSCLQFFEAKNFRLKLTILYYIFKHSIKIDIGISAQNVVCNKFGLFIKSRSNHCQQPLHIRRK
jgi:hypothetical protein